MKTFPLFLSLFFLFISAFTQEDSYPFKTVVQTGNSNGKTFLVLQGNVYRKVQTVRDINNMFFVDGGQVFRHQLPDYFEKVEHLSLQEFANLYQEDYREMVKEHQQNKEEIKTKEFPTGEYTDSRDGNIYDWVQIGEQVWMAENLKFIPRNMKGFWMEGNFERNSKSIKSTDYYKNYGLIYNYETALSSCPEGWTLASRNDWENLFNYIGGNTEFLLDSLFWKNSLSNESVNLTRFGIRPGGYYSCRLQSVDNEALFWTTNKDMFTRQSISNGKPNPRKVFCVKLNSNSQFAITRLTQVSGASVRCVRK